MSLVTAQAEPWQSARAAPLTLDKAGSALELVIIMMTLLLFSQGLLGLLFVPKDAVHGPAWLRLLFYPFYLTTIAMIVMRPWSSINALTRSILLLLPVLMALVSVQWSIMPEATYRRAVALMMTTVFAIYLASRYDWADFIEVLASCFAILALMSLFMAVFVPSKGIMHETFPGAWSGIWYEKNDLGMNMAKAVHLFLCAMIFRPKRIWLWAPFMVLALVLLLLSTSKTSLLAAFLGVSGVAALYIFRRGPLIGIPLVYFGVVLGVALALGVEYAPKFMFGLIGKDPTLTGHTDIWKALFDQIKNHPWFGHGYGVFWLDEIGPAFWVRQRTQWLVPTAHNGWLETWLSIGLGGVILFAVAYISTLAAALRGLLHGKAAYWALISTLVFLLFSISESNILQQNSLGWIVFAATAAKLFGARPLHRAAAP